MALINNTYYRTYDANGQIGDFDDHDILIDTNVTGAQLLKQLISGDPFKGVVNLVNTAKKFNINSELTSLIGGSTKIPLNSITGRLANMDNYKFQYGINDTLLDTNVTLFNNFVDKIEDPTILTFTIEIDQANSPLFQTDGGVGSINEFIAQRQQDFPTDGLASLEGNNLIVSSNIGGLYDRMDLMLQEFQKTFLDFFTSYQTSTIGPKSKSYYIQSVGGISELDKVWTGEGGGNENYKYSKLKVTMREDVKMSARNLYFLYNSLKMHRRSGKTLIPENLMRFNMWVKISEIRNFTSLRFAVETGANQDIIDAIKRDVTAIYYYVQDCSLDFSKLHKETYTVEDTREFENLEFEIIFRRAYRVFKPTLLKSEATDDDQSYFGIDERLAQPAILNKGYALNNFSALNSIISKNSENSVMPIRPTLSQELTPFTRSASDPVNWRTAPTSSTKTLPQLPNSAKSNQSKFQALGKFLSTGQVNLNPNNVQGLTGTVLNLASKAITTLAKAAKNTVIQKRNQLVRDLENKVKNQVGFGVPRPDNLYMPGVGTGVIGSTLQSLSKATGIDFLAIRNGQNIQSFSNTDVQTLNPALEGRDILHGPGGDYSKLNPNAAHGEIANVEPVTPSTTDIKVLNNNLMVGAPFNVDLSNIQDNLQKGGPSTDNLRNIKFENLQQGAASTDDLNNLKDNLQQGAASTDDLKNLKDNLQQGGPSSVDLKNIKKENLQQGGPSTDDLKNIEKENLQRGAASNNDTKTLNVNLQPVPRSLLEKISFKNVNAPNGLSAVKTNDTTVIKNVNVDKDGNANVNTIKLDGNLMTGAASTDDLKKLNDNLQQGATSTDDLKDLNQNLMKGENSVDDLKNLDVNLQKGTIAKPEELKGNVNAVETNAPNVDINKNVNDADLKKIKKDEDE